MNLSDTFLERSHHTLFIRNRNKAVTIFIFVARLYAVPDPMKGGPHELTESQKKLVAEDPAQTLDQQENMKISGSNARHMVMQKLMRKSQVSGGV